MFETAILFARRAPQGVEEWRIDTYANELRFGL